MPNAPQQPNQPHLPGMDVKSIPPTTERARVTRVLPRILVPRPKPKNQPYLPGMSPQEAPDKPLRSQVAKQLAEVMRGAKTRPLTPLPEPKTPKAPRVKGVRVVRSIPKAAQPINGPSQTAPKQNAYQRAQRQAKAVAFNPQTAVGAVASPAPSAPQPIVVNIPSNKSPVTTGLNTAQAAVKIPALQGPQFDLGGVNRTIVVAVVVIGGTGMLRAAITHQPFTPIVVGSLLLLVFLSLIDLFGGPLSTIASALALLAMVVVLLQDLPSIFQQLNASRASALKKA